jgi:hypothetical protein
LKIRYCYSLKTNLFDNDLLTSVRTPTPPPDVIVIVIIIKFLALGILKLVSVYCTYRLCFSIIMFSPTSCPLRLQWNFKCRSLYLCNKVAFQNFLVSL